MFNNAKFGVEFKSIKVAKGGCVVAGEAVLNHVDLALLNEEQRKKLAEAYQALNVVADLANAFAPQIASAINKTVDAINKLKEKLTEKKRQTKALLANFTIDKEGTLIQNCQEIADNSKALQDSLEKMIGLVKTGKLKANLGKLQEMCKDNVAFMNKLAPALAGCQGLEKPVLRDEKGCSGPCANPWDLMPREILFVCNKEMEAVFGVDNNSKTEPKENTNMVEVNITEENEYFSYASWATSSKTQITNLNYGVKTVYLKLTLKKSLKDKSITVFYYDNSDKVALKSRVYKVENNNLELMLPIDFTIDDFAKTGHDDIANYMYKIEFLGKKYTNSTDWLKVHAVIYLPEIMKKLGWNYSFKSQDDWFKGNPNNYPWESSPKVNDFEFEWALNFERFKANYEANKDVWKDDKSIISLRNEIKKMITDGYAITPTVKNKKTTFGTFGGNIISLSRKHDEVGYANESMPLFEKYYFKNLEFDELTITGDLDDFFGSIANCNIHFAAKGELEYKGIDNIEVTITELGVYVKDGFDFVGTQQLGFWSLKDKNVTKGLKPDYNLVDNKSYRDYQSDSKKGGNFYRYSKIYIQKPNFKFKL